VYEFADARRIEVRHRCEIQQDVPLTVPQECRHGTSQRARAWRAQLPDDANGGSAGGVFNNRSHDNTSGPAT
jgi:hypothetical protein